LKFKTFMQLTRVEHSLMLVLAVLIGQVLQLGHIPGAEIALFASIPAFLIGLASFAINDFFDVETDRKNKRMDRPLVNGSASKSEAYFLSILLFILGVLVSFLLPEECYFLAGAFAIAAFLYSFKLKDIPLVGNIYIALTMAVPFVYGAYSVMAPAQDAMIFPKISIFILAAIALVMGIAREIAGDVRDMEGDKERKSKTLPFLVGRKSALYIHSLLYLLAVCMSAYPYLYLEGFMGNIGYLLFIGITDIMLMYAAISTLLDGSVKALKLSRNISLAAMGTGLLGFLLGSI
jgi:geranylgeranylglycerol-phosphate geranylgeranyltransferase